MIVLTPTKFFQWTQIFPTLRESLYIAANRQTNKNCYVEANASVYQILTLVGFRFCNKILFNFVDDTNAEVFLAAIYIENYLTFFPRLESSKF